MSSGHRQQELALPTMRPPAIHEVIRELGFNREYQAAWDELYVRLGMPANPTRDQREEFIRSIEVEYSLWLVRPDHGGLPWRGWVRRRDEPKTETPPSDRPHLEVERVGGRVVVRVVDASGAS